MSEVELSSTLNTADSGSTRFERFDGTKWPTEIFKKVSRDAVLTKSLICTALLFPVIVTIVLLKGNHKFVSGFCPRNEVPGKIFPSESEDECYFRNANSLASILLLLPFLSENVISTLILARVTLKNAKRLKDGYSGHIMNIEEDWIRALTSSDSTFSRHSAFWNTSRFNWNRSNRTSDNINSSYRSNDKINSSTRTAQEFSRVSSRKLPSLTFAQHVNNQSSNSVGSAFVREEVARSIDSESVTDRPVAGEAADDADKKDNIAKIVFVDGELGTLASTDKMDGAERLLDWFLRRGTIGSTFYSILFVATLPVVCIGFFIYVSIVIPCKKDAGIKEVCISVISVAASESVAETFVNHVAMQVFAQLDDVLVRMITHPRRSLGVVLDGYCDGYIDDYRDLEKQDMRQRQIQENNIDHDE